MKREFFRFTFETISSRKIEKKRVIYIRVIGIFVVLFWPLIEIHFLWFNPREIYFVIFSF